MDKIVLTQPNKITLTAEQALKEDGTLKKVQVIDAFVNPENLSEKIITVEFYYGMTESADSEGNVVYKGYSNREKITVGIPVTTDAVQAAIQNLWDSKYVDLDNGVNELEIIKEIEL